MQREEYIDTLKKRFTKNGFLIVDGGHMGGHELIFSASKDNSVWWLPGNEGAFFFVTEIDSPDINILKRFSSDCSHYAYSSLKKGFLKKPFPPFVLSYSIAITDQVDSLLVKVLDKTQPLTRWGTYVLEYPIVVIPETGQLFYPPHRIVKDGHFHTLDGSMYYDQTPDYIDYMLSPANSEIRQWPPKRSKS
jgi:hypothetical protein